MMDERMAARAKAYDAEFGDMEARHRLQRVGAYALGILSAILAGVAVGRWWHPLFAFVMGLGMWSVVGEARRDCDRDAERRKMHGID